MVQKSGTRHDEKLYETLLQNLLPVRRVIDKKL